MVIDVHIRVARDSGGVVAVWLSSQRDGRTNVWRSSSSSCCCRDPASRIGPRPLNTRPGIPLYGQPFTWYDWPSNMVEFMPRSLAIGLLTPRYPTVIHQEQDAGDLFLRFPSITNPVSVRFSCLSAL